jgi:hypothetical protein
MSKKIGGKDKAELNELKEYALGDDDIKKYLPNSKIITYKELARYHSIDELLPNNPDYVFILYEDSINKGHWTLLMKYNNTYEFFCSYGSKIDEPLTWYNEQTRNRLGEDTPYLSNMLNAVSGKVIYNPVKFQKDSNDINSCGRHALVRALSLLNSGITLKNYQQKMKKIKSLTGGSYDDIVSAITYDLD